MSIDCSDLEQFSQIEWDAIVIGTGMGGATLGYALAKAGRRVLFCERGKSLTSTEHGLRGDFAETFFDTPEVPQVKHRSILIDAGRYGEEIEEVGTRPRRYIPFIGSVSGGSTALYGAALERFFPEDFSPRQNYVDAKDSTLPQAWPIHYEELVPYYEAAEALYRVRGTTDPCRRDSARPLLEPPAISPAGQELQKHLMQKGLRPYRLPIACDYLPGCRGCQGFLCPKNCKNDSNKICLRPAIEQHQAKLVDECEVVRLEVTRDTVTGIVCHRRGCTATLRTNTVILAAGALETPRILLGSTSNVWPRGVANESGLVGKNLMRHYVDLYAISPNNRYDLPGNRKELAFNDFYCQNGQKFGTVQSFGVLPPAPYIVEGMAKDVNEGSLWWLAPFFQFAKPILKVFLARTLSNRVLFASIMEDLPYADNEVTISTGGHSDLAHICFSGIGSENSTVYAFPRSGSCCENHSRPTASCC